nr:MAG TPA: hypothetical protein [Caudoviricetes sp.]
MLWKLILHCCTRKLRTSQISSDLILLRVKITKIFSFVFLIFANKTRSYVIVASSLLRQMVKKTIPLQMEIVPITR